MTLLLVCCKVGATQPDTIAAILRCGLLEHAKPQKLQHRQQTRYHSDVQLSTVVNPFQQVVDNRRQCGYVGTEGRHVEQNLQQQAGAWAVWMGKPAISMGLVKPCDPKNFSMLSRRMHVCAPPIGGLLTVSSAPKPVSPTTSKAHAYTCLDLLCSCLISVKSCRMLWKRLL